MAWTAGVHRATGYLVTADNWNSVQDNLDYLKGTSGTTELDDDIALNKTSAHIYRNVNTDHFELRGGDGYCALLALYGGGNALDKGSHSFWVPNAAIDGWLEAFVIEGGTDHPDLYPQYNIEMQSGKTVDGVDVSAHAAGTPKAQHIGLGLDAEEHSSLLLIDQDIDNGVTVTQTLNLSKDKLYSIRCIFTNETDSTVPYGMTLQIVDSNNSIGQSQQFSSGSDNNQVSVFGYTGPSAGGTTPYLKVQITNLIGSTKHFHCDVWYQDLW